MEPYLGWKYRETPRNTESVSLELWGIRRYYPRRRRAGCISIIRAEALRGGQNWTRLAVGASALKFVPEVAEVIRADAEVHHFVDDRQEVSQRADRAQRRSVRWADEPACGREHKRDRYQRRSLILTSQMPVAHWHEQIGDPTIADSILDRVIHNAHRIELKGESMRKKKRKPGEEEAQ